MIENFKNFAQEKLKNPKTLAISAGVLGLLVGLFIAWVLFPVRWVDTNAETMRPDLRQDYLRMVITNYNLTYDQAKAQQLYAELGGNAKMTLEEVTAQPGYLGRDQVNKFANAILASPVDIGTQAVAPTEVAEPAEKKPFNMLTLGLVLLLILAGGAFLTYWFFYRNKAQEGTGSVNGGVKVKLPASMGGMAQAREGAAPAQQDFVTQAQKPMVENQDVIIPPKPVMPAATRINGAAISSEEKPVVQFISSYMFGQDLYDDSFTFDAPNGEFLGECGISISDILGVGEPKKISAFEVWLFDKNDIQTVTKVLMSYQSYQDVNRRQRLEIKGEPILADKGKQVLLETASLRLEARIINLIYGEQADQDMSYFHDFSIELAVYRK